MTSVPAQRPDPPDPDPGIGQRDQWEAALGERPDRYGQEASAPARAALELLQAGRARNLLELGGGQGRDSLFFAAAGLRVTVVDFARPAVATISAKAEAAGLTGLVSAVESDVRDPLPFRDGSFDGCYAHMLFCMALSQVELLALAAEIRRVLRPGGLCIYTARTTGDPDYGRGTALGGNLFELGGFVVHFFDRDTVAALAEGFELHEVEEFSEGALPRRLFRVTMGRA